MIAKTLITETKHYRVFRRCERHGVVFEVDLLPMFGSDFFESKDEAVDRGEQYAEFVAAGPDHRRRR